MSVTVISPRTNQHVDSRHVIRVRFGAEFGYSDIKITLNSETAFHRSEVSDKIGLVGKHGGAKHKEIHLRTKKPLSDGPHIVTVMLRGEPAVVGHRFWVGPPHAIATPSENRSDCGSFWIDDHGKWFCNGVDMGVTLSPRLEVVGVCCALDREGMKVVWLERGHMYERLLPKRMNRATVRACRRGMDITILAYSASRSDLYMASLDNEQSWSCRSRLKQIGATKDWVHVALPDYTLHWPSTYYTGSAAYMDEWLVVHAPMIKKNWLRLWTDDDHIWWTKSGSAVSFASPDLIKSKLEAVVWSRQDMGLSKIESLRPIGTHLFIANEDTVIDTKNIRVRPA